MLTGDWSWSSRLCVQQRANQMKRVLMLVICLAAMTAVSIVHGGDGGKPEPFRPVHNLTTWYTDRTPIDIEIVGSSSMMPELHHLEPERTLRLRLERAYVDFLTTESEPGYDFIHLSFDIETGLPESLFFAVANKRRFHEDFEGIPILPFAEQVRRTLNISIQSDAAAATLQHASETYRKECAGAPIGNGLRVFEWKDWKVPSHCWPPTYPNGSLYVADYSGDLSLKIQCQEESFRGTGCSLDFPFEGFAVTLSFHRDHLQDWRGMIDRASDFLRRKEYH